MDRAGNAVKHSALIALATVMVVGCGSEAGPKAPRGVSQKSFEQQLAEASNVRAADFPATRGRTLQEIADTTAAGNGVGFATSALVPGTQRLALGVLDRQNRFIYGKTGVYIAASPSAKAQGPYAAPADTLITKPAFRSQTAASEKDPIASIYAVQAARAVRHPRRHQARPAPARRGRPGHRSLEHADSGHRRASAGDRHHTVSSAGGDVKAIDTRVPAAPELHKVSLKDVLGRKPTVLLFATPQLCQSRVCGPVVDIELQMKDEFGDKLAWIHEEVYRNNQVNDGLRPQLRTFHLQTEPWLFTLDRQGRVAARMEGSFGVSAFRDAVDAALRR